MTNEAEAMTDLQAIEEQLRGSLGDEEFLVDILQAGAEARDFRASKAGRAMLSTVLKDQYRALQVLVEPNRKLADYEPALRQLQVAYAAMRIVLDAVDQGRQAERAINEMDGGTDE